MNAISAFYFDGCRGWRGERSGKEIRDPDHPPPPPRYYPLSSNSDTNPRRGSDPTQPENSKKSDEPARGWVLGARGIPFTLQSLFSPASFIPRPYQHPPNSFLVLPTRPLSRFPALPPAKLLLLPYFALIRLQPLPPSLSLSLSVFHPHFVCSLFPFLCNLSAVSHPDLSSPLYYHSPCANSSTQHQQRRRRRRQRHGTLPFSSS